MGDHTVNLTPKQRSFLAALQEGKGTVQACRDAGYAPSTAEDQSGRTLKAVANKIGCQLEHWGINDQWFIETLKRNAEAMNEKTGAPAGCSMPALELLLRLRGDLDIAKEETRLGHAADELRQIFIGIDVQAVLNLAEGKTAPTLKELRIERETRSGPAQAG